MNQLVLTILSHLKSRGNPDQFVEPASVLDFLHRCAVSTNIAMQAMQEAMDAALIEEGRGGVRMTVLGEKKIDDWINSLTVKANG